MKVLLAGYHNPNFTNTVVLRKKALEDLGHQVVFFHESGFRLPGRIRDRFEALQEWDLERLNQDLVRLAKSQKPDAVIAVGGHTLLPKTIDQITQTAPTALWTTDVPVVFENILAGARFYRRRFCAGTEAVDIFQDHGLPSTWLPFACDPTFHHPVGVNQQEHKDYGKDVIFVGSYYPNRAAVLESLADLDIKVWGPYWGKLSAQSPLKPKTVDVKMGHGRWTTIFSACRINLVIHYQDGRTPCHQASPKIFEAMACGSFVLSDRQKDVQALFKEGEHLAFFDDARDLRDKIRYYLGRPQERTRIAQAGQKEVLQQHTYKQRMKTILEALP